MLPYSENPGNYFVSALTGRKFNYVRTDKESRRKALANLQASDAEAADAIQTRAQRELGRKLSERELLSGQWAPDSRSKYERECDDLATQGCTFNPYRARLATLTATGRNLSPEALASMEAKAAAWQAPKPIETGPKSPYSAIIRDLTTATSHDPEERRRNATMLERYKSLDATWQEENSAKAADAQRREDPIFKNAVRDAELCHKYLNLQHASKQEWVESAKARLDKLVSDGPDGVDSYFAATRAFDQQLNAEMDATTGRINGQIRELKDLKAAVLKGDAPVDAQVTA